MNESDLAQVVETGEQLPRDMFDGSLLKEADGEDMVLPVFDGVKVVDEAKE
jgi:hypothetical protein